MEQPKGRILIFNRGASGPDPLVDLLVGANYSVQILQEPDSVTDATADHGPDLILLDPRVSTTPGLDPCRLRPAGGRATLAPDTSPTERADNAAERPAFAESVTGTTPSPCPENPAPGHTVIPPGIARSQPAGEPLEQQNAASSSDFALSTDRFPLAMAATHLGLWEFDPGTGSVCYSSQWKQMLGYADEEIADEFAEWESRLHPADREATVRAFWEYASGARPDYETTFRLRNKDGAYRWMYSRGEKAFDAAGKVIRIQGSHVDITEALRLHEQRERILTLSQDLICIAGWDDRFRYLNPAWEAVTGCSHDELLSRPVSDLFHVDGKDLAQLLGECVDRPGAAFRFEDHRLHKDGSARLLRWVAIPVPDERTTYCIGRDVTERKRMEDALVDSEARFHTTFEQAAVGMAHVSLEGRFLRTNRKFCDIVGYSRDELECHNFEDLTFSDDIAESREILADLVNGRIDHCTLEKRYIRKDGSLVWVQITSSLVRDEGGQPLWIVSVIQDISDRVEAQQEVRSYQEHLRALASRLALAEDSERRRIASELHDRVGQNLAFSRILLSKASRIARGGQLATLLHEASEAIHESIHDTRDLVFDLSSPLLEKVGLAAAIANYLEERVASKHGIEVELKRGPEPAPLSPEANALLFRCVRELLTNVIRHSEATKVVVSLEGIDNGVRVAVRDNGVGFVAHKKLSAAGEESSFGLFSIREQMANVGGSLEIESQPHMGCTAVLTLHTAGIPRLRGRAK